MVALLLDNDSEAPPPSPTEAEPIIAPAPVPTLTLETVEGPTAGPSSESEPPTATVDEALRHVDCLTCGGTGHLADLGTCLSCGGGGQCVPGRKPCYPYEYHTTVGRFFGMIYECLCCPDPCYEPTWVPEANAAFFVDYARPKTVTRIRYDFFNNLQFPDRAEYFWAEAALNRTGQPVGRGPTPPSFRYPNLRGMPYNRGFPAIDMSQVSLYTEAATKRAAFFFEFPYRSLQVIPQPPFNPNNLTLLRHAAGFSDMNLGTKSLLLDCELLQLTFQFRTFLPLGNVTKGLGNGHVSLEPSLLGTLKLGPQTYLQGQISEWVPLGGDPDYQGAILHYHGSLNQVLYRFTPDVPLIGTLECSGWSFQDGLYTDPVLGPVPASGGTYFNVGPGLRMSICKKVDFGGAVAWPVSDFHWADPLVRAEIRILY